MKKALVAIGVDKTGGLPPLMTASDGACRIEAWAKKQGFDTELLIDKSTPVTLNDITSTIRTLVDRKIYDRLVVYFSGHGFLKAPNYEIWLLSGAPDNANEAINVSGSIDLSRNCGISHIVFISDACRSIPNTVGMNYVQGGLIFPARAQRAPSPEVDTFYATIPGNPAMEVPTDQAATNYRGIFTDCLLKALLGGVDEVARTISEENVDKVVVPSRPLKQYLLTAVPDAATAVSIKIQQDPDIRVESDLPKYLGELPPAQESPSLGQEEAATPLITARLSITTVTPTASRSASVEDIYSRFMKMYFLNRSASNQQDLITSSMARNWETEIRAILNTKSQREFDFFTGFIVHGAKVMSATALGASCATFEESGQSHVRVRNMPTPDRHNIRPFHQGTSFLRSRSILMRFDRGNGACLAALPGYVGNVMVSEDGRILTVNYTPARKSRKYEHYQMAAEDLERRRAFASVAARNGSFFLDPREAPEAAHYLRMFKSIDPTLGIYAAYAYAQAGYQEGVDSIYRYMTDRNSVEYSPVPFDIFMLAYRNGHNPKSLEMPHYKGCMKRISRSLSLPMLTQGWAMLGDLEEFIHPAALKARNHLIPSLWTAFTTKGIDILEVEMNSGEFRWT